MGDILEDFLVAAPVSAIEANLWEFGAYLGQSPQVELHDRMDMLWYATGIASPMLNGVFRTQLAPRETDVRIEATLDYFRSRKLPMVWWISPSTRPADLEQHLEAHGFTLSADMLGMAIDLVALKEHLPSPSHLTIKPVEDVDTLREWAHPFAATFGFPDSTVSTFCDLFASLSLDQRLPLHHYVGWLKGDPVACSSMFLGAGVAGIYNVATIPDKRGQGIGAALTWEPLCYARKAGYRIGVLHSSPMGFNVYRRIGFKEYCKIRTYVSTPETN
jgi:ribosomal protein S18 acetylase RimI-like enzyme